MVNLENWRENWIMLSVMNSLNPFMQLKPSFFCWKFKFKFFIQTPQKSLKCSFCVSGFSNYFGSLIRQCASSLWRFWSGLSRAKFHEMGMLIDTKFSDCLAVGVNLGCHCRFANMKSIVIVEMAKVEVMVETVIELKEEYETRVLK